MFASVHRRFQEIQHSLNKTSNVIIDTWHDKRLMLPDIDGTCIDLEKNILVIDATAQHSDKNNKIKHH